MLDELRYRWPTRQSVDVYEIVIVVVGAEFDGHVLEDAGWW